MDIRALRALATSALYPYLKGQSSGTEVHDGGKDANGAEFPDQVAATVLQVPAEYSWFFSLGFDFGLSVAAAIASNPTSSPDLTAAIAKIAKEIPKATKSAEEYIGAARGAAA
jgi:hypothetical protein